MDSGSTTTAFARIFPDRPCQIYTSGLEALIDQALILEDFKSREAVIPDRPRYTNGNVRLAWTNPNGGPVVVWRTTNRALTNWSSLATNTSPWTNVAPPSPSYYRLTLP